MNREAMELICEECGAAIPGDTCEKCHKTAPLWAVFCPHCGQSLVEKRSAAKSAKTGRRLCSDESCIGIIGPAGVCVECGKRP
jgi:predicted amidophosphoribosyltransferase